ncbi:MAG: radical SAM protein [Akkermansiaceae bacterium]|nr:radical SAM protein [Akkermansiaceae bacterium]
MKIGFIAISGLRVVDSALLELGLSFPGLAGRAREIEALPSLGLLTLAGMTPAHIATEYLELRDVDLDYLPRDFDAVAISTLTATSKEAYRLAARFKRENIPVILGGLHATLAPEEAARHVDCLVIGEGESVWPEIVRDLEAGKLKSCYDAKARGPFDFDHAPMPRFDLLQPDRYPRFTIQTQRGCPLSCEFCAASMRLSPVFRTKPVDKIIAEVRRIKELFQHPFIELADDNTFSDKRHSKHLMRALEKENINWFTESDVSLADDEDLVRMVRDAGCRQILIGFESPQFKTMDGVETQSNWKARRTERYLEAVETIQKHGIAVNGCFILGMDGDGVDSFDQVFQFVNDSGLHDVQITYLTPFPGTPLYQRLSEEGRILVQGASERCTLFDINFQPDNMSVSELRDGYTRLMTRLYNDAFIDIRRKKFLGHLRQRIKHQRTDKQMLTG